MRGRAAGLLAATALSACAHGRGAEPPLPTEEPAPPRARLYAACTGAAIQAGAITRFGRFVRYRCEGEPARALFDEVAALARNRGQETREGGRTVRRLSAATWDDTCIREEAADGSARFSCFIDQGTPSGFLSGDDAAPRKH